MAVLIDCSLSEKPRLPGRGFLHEDTVVDTDHLGVS